MRKVCYWFVWLYFFTVPWEHSLNIDGLGDISRVVTLCSIPVAAVAVGTRGGFRKVNLLHVLMFVFFLWTGATFWWTIDPEATLAAIRTYLQVMIAVWLAWEFAPDFDAWRKLGVAYMLGAYVSVANTFRDFAMNAIATATSSEARFNADGWDQNDLALTLALGILIARQASIGGSRPVRFLAFSYIPLAIVAIALTGSRGGAIVAAIAMLGIGLQWSGTWTQKICMFSVLLLAGYIGLSYVPENTLDRIFSITSGIGDMSARVPIWHAGITKLPSFLFFGSGAGAFPLASGTGMVAHNTFLSILLEEGSLGFAVFVSMVILMTFYAWRAGSQLRSLWITILICWCVGVSTLTWEQTRLTWVIFAFAGALSDQGFQSMRCGNVKLRRLAYFVEAC